MSQAHRTGAGRLPLGVDKSFFRKKSDPPVNVLPVLVGFSPKNDHKIIPSTHCWVCFHLPAARLPETIRVAERIPLRASKATAPL